MMKYCCHLTTMDTLTWFMLLLTLLDVQGVWPSYFMAPNSKKNNEGSFTSGSSNLETKPNRENPIWSKPDIHSGGMGRPAPGYPGNAGRPSGGSHGSFLLLNSNASLPGLLPTAAARGSVALLTPPARFNNNLVPTFANTTATNVTAIRGKAAYLHCHVTNLGTKTVSWVRHHDIHVLTVGRITFTNDDRFEAMNKPGSDIWRLRIKYPQFKDAGKYECQVSVKPPIARVINLDVVEPQAIIHSGPELYVDHGSPLNITCLVPDSPEPPENIFWYHRDKMVSWDGSRRGVSITTEKGPVTTSNLFIPDVTAHDSGVYVCSPQGMKEASVRVRVLNGELPQAMQTGSTCKGCAGSHVLLLLLMALNRLVVL